MEKETNAPAKGKKKTKYGFLVRFILKLLIIAAATYIVMTFIFGAFILRGNYMFPAVRDGDLVITYRLEDYVIGDVVLYRTDAGTKVGRIVGLPGQEISVSEDGQLSVNGAVPSEQIFYLTDQGSLRYPCTLGDDEYFILNDFRSDTNDSRDSGPIAKKQLQGKSVFVIRRRGF